MTPLETTWSLGTLIWLPISALLVIGLIAFGEIAKRAREGASTYDKGLWTGTKWCSRALALLFVIGTALGMYPYAGEYHQWRDVAGTVASIDNRLIGTGDGMETKFVVRFADTDQQYGCDDTRCAQVREGDRLTLSCIRAWQYTGTDGYDCRFVSTEAHR